jgi:hypothetical protein
MSARERNAALTCCKKLLSAPLDTSNSIPPTIIVTLPLFQKRIVPNCPLFLNLSDTWSSRVSRMSNVGAVNVQEPGGGGWSKRVEALCAVAMSSEESSSSLTTTDSSVGGAISNPDALERDSTGKTGFISAAANAAVAATGGGSTWKREPEEDICVMLL